MISDSDFDIYHIAMARLMHSGYDSTNLFGACNQSTSPAVISLTLLKAFDQILHLKINFEIWKWCVLLCVRVVQYLDR